MTHRPNRYAYLDHPGPLAFAHRGAHEAAGENTMEAVEAAVRLGYRYIETDVQATRDGVAVLVHDDTLARMFDAPGAVSDHSWAELARLETGRGERVARLDAALAAFPETRFNLDAKTEAAVAPMAETIARCGALERVCVASEDVRRTHRVRKLLGGDVCWSPGHGGVLGLWLAGWGAPGAGRGIPAVQIPTQFRHIPVATRRLVAAARARGTQVHVWTIDDPGEMAALLEIGVDGLMTDRPRVLKEVLQRRGQWHE